MASSTNQVAGTASRKPNKAMFKAAVVGCMRASSEEELEMWTELLRDEIALFQELEKLHKGDRDEIEAFFGGNGSDEECDGLWPIDQKAGGRSAGDDRVGGAV